MALTDIPYLTASWTAPASDLTDYVGYFDLSNAPQSWWDEVDTSDGTKMRAAKDDAAEGATTATELPFEVVDFDDVGQTGHLWFRWSGTLPATSPDDVRIYPAKASATSYGVTDTFGRKAVWVNFYKVAHDGATGDATGNGNTGSITGATAGGATGKIGSATSYGNNERSTGANGMTMTDAITVIAWVNFNDTANEEYQSIGFIDSGSSEYLVLGERAGQVKLYSNGETPGEGGTVVSSTWYRIAFTIPADSASFILYNNGSNVHSASFNSTNWQSSDTWAIGDARQSFIAGTTVDEAWYANSEFSADYLALDHANQNSVGTFWSSITLDNTGGATYTLTAEQGSYSLTGQATGLLRTLRLISEQGSYAYTGQTTNLLKTYLLAAEQGSYSIVGADSELLETFILEAQSGSYSLTGQETLFFRTLKLISEQGSYSLSGQTTNLLRNLLLTAEQGSYSLSGQDAIISAVSNYILTAESGSYSLTGNDTAFLRNLILEAEQGSYTLTGQQTELLRKLLLSAASGNYSLTGQDIALTVEDSPEILILMSAIVSSLELDSTITTELDLDSSV